LHFPVLLREVIELLDPGPGDVILDATVGGGGHAKEIIKRILPGGRLIAVDRDPEALERARKAIGEREEVIYTRGDFRQVHKIIETAGVGGIDGALFDLGISSYQVDEGGRGFSFNRDGPLDMRFDPKQRLSAREIVNRFGRRELADIIRSYGEERHAKIVAAAIVASRGKDPIETTTQLSKIIVSAVGRRYRNQKLHPAARTFQALRIYVNDELSAVEEAVKRAVPLLSPGGRICVISFHSLEDRIVKNLFRDMAKAGGISILTKKPIRPGSPEVSRNPRSRSAKLRAAERTR